MPGSAPGEAGLSKAVQGTGDTPREGCVWDVEMCLNTGEGTVQPSPGHGELSRTQMADSWTRSGRPGRGHTAGLGRAEWSSHNKAAAPVLQALDGEAGEVRGLRTRSWVEVLVMNSGVQRGKPVGRGAAGEGVPKMRVGVQAGL